MPSKINDEDPLSIAIAPPPDESEEQREARIRAEKQAKKISDAIDDELNRQRIAEKKAVKPVKVLLLGQSESGKSTTLKNFQLMNSPKAFRAERPSWRAIIQLNVVRSFRLILDTLSDAQAGTPLIVANAPNPPPHDLDFPESPTSASTGATMIANYPDITPELLRLKLRLSPLFQVEAILLKRLHLTSQGSVVVETAAQLTSDRAHGSGNAGPGEVSVNSTVPWKVAFTRFMKNDQENVDTEPEVDPNDPNDPRVVLNACASDMVRLWRDPIVKTLLALRKIRLEDMPGFFLDNLERVTSLKYIPTDDDILKARLKTLGVSEHRFVMQSAANATTRDWRVFDVGGHRSLRTAWVPYFDDIDAIIFLAPISCFDQVLAEDESINRLEDSVLLWKSIVANPLLKKTNLVLFLNKCDILKEKLASGIRLADYILSYGDRPNDFDNASNYLRKKFANILKEYSPVKRPFYCHTTSVIDKESTFHILINVQDMLLRQNLKDVALIA